MSLEIMGDWIGKKINPTKSNLLLYLYPKVVLNATNNFSGSGSCALSTLTNNVYSHFQPSFLTNIRGPANSS